MDNEPRIEQRGNVLSVYFTFQEGWEKWFMLSSDRHHDSKYCDRELEKVQLDKAVKRDAFIIDAGDVLDAMQGRYDPRRMYDDLRPEYMVDNYYDAIIQDASEFYKPYAANWLLMGRGNHEEATRKNANTDITSRLVDNLNRGNGGHIAEGGFGGWIRFMFMRSKRPQSSLKLKYFHGSNATDAPVTRGVIQTNRQSVFLPDADIVMNGHNHNEYILSIKRERISNKGRVYFDLVHFARIPGYKNEYQDGSGSWAVQKGQSPKPLGIVWMRLFYEQEIIKCELTADII
jgi:predicted phosphodiesterase